MMTLQQVHYFLTLCDEQNFTRAATRCGVSQPSLTSAIKQLERELGGPLFVRRRRISCLSDLGVAVQPHLAAMERAATIAKRESAEFVADGLATKPALGHLRPIIGRLAAVARTIFNPRRQTERFIASRFVGCSWGDATERRLNGEIAKCDWTHL